MQNSILRGAATAFGVITGLLVLQVACSPVGAQTLGDRIEARREARQGADTQVAGTLSTLEVDGLTRQFHVHLPATLGPAPGVVLVFHGGGGTGEMMISQNPLVPAADAAGFIAVFPDSYDGNWTDGRIATMDGPDDVAFVRALVADLARTYGADPSRVYATGISNGAIFSHKLACDAPGMIRAIAPVAGNMPEALMANCSPRSPTPVMMFNGTADPFMPYAGGEPENRRLIALARGPITDSMISSEDTIAFWARQNGCSSEQSEDLPDLADDGTTVTRIAWDCGAATLFRINGGGHTWPGTTVRIAERLNGPTSMDIDAASEMVRFFRVHGL